MAASWLQVAWWDGWRGPENWYLGALPSRYEREWEASGRSFPILAGLGWKLLMEAYDRVNGNRDALAPDQLGAVERVIAEPLARWGYPVSEPKRLDQPLPGT